MKHPPRKPPDKNNPFRILANLRGTKSSAQGRKDGTVAPAHLPENVSEEAGRDDKLFRREMRGVKPLPAQNRAVVERPRPQPVRRAPEPKAPREKKDDTRAAEDPLKAAYEGVTPLRDTGRIVPQAKYSFRSQNRENDEGVQQDDKSSDLFHQAMRNVRPLTTTGKAIVERPRAEPLPLKRREDERAALDESLRADFSVEDRLEGGEETTFLRTGLPRKVLTDLRRGKWVRQEEIDLHGLTREQARLALSEFLNESLIHGWRCVRVIHGKGKGSPGGVSVLKQLSRHWLAQREEILAFCQAGPNDGGSGALLVLLRAPGVRKKPTA